jgi:lantibiotic modifying enzyme
MAFLCKSGLDYERALFVPEAGNWSDLRAELNLTGQQVAFANQWCHGATGIGFSRLGMLDVFDTPENRQEIAAAVLLTLSQVLPPVDHLCCGSAGQISFLFEAARRLDRPDWEQAARQRLAALLDRAGQTCSYTLYPKLPPTVINPGFMQGYAGIGYEWHRLANPGLNLPNCLLFD